MTQIAIEQVLSSRYRTSAEADRYNTAIMDGLSLSTRAAAARLAIGRSLGVQTASMDDEVSATLDAKGVEVQGQTLFSVSDIAAWIGLIVTHGKLHGSTIKSFDDFRSAVRFHWHRGAYLLMADWEGCDKNYDRFVKVLVTRRASLKDRVPRKIGVVDLTQHALEAKGRLDVIKALTEIGISAESRGMQEGPRMTRYEVGLLDVSQFDRLKKSLQQLALSLGVNNCIPSISLGTEAKSVFLDFARDLSQWTAIGFADLERWNESEESLGDLPVFVGLDVSGKNVSFDLETMPHLLIGGTTGAGKSVCVHSIILSLLIGRSSGNIRLALIDPKQVEFSPYSTLRCIYGKEVISETPAALKLLQQLVAEMESRYTTFKGLGVSNIAGARAAGLDLPYIVVFVEEFADLILQNKQIEPLVVRLAQKARAAGIHLVLATQRPDAKTFSGLIRSNVPARIALTVQKEAESRIILDDGGAELLTGRGDMLIKLPGKTVARAHGPLITLEDVQNVVSRR
jgi:DNA segregation ATPase FtsK/SpoIIIE, S-DNA-T family